MKILIDIGHPAHVHLFKNFARKMQEKGHQVLFTCREKEFEIELLKANNFTYQSFGKKYKTIIGKILGLIKFDYMEWKSCLKFKPDVLLSHGSMYAAHAAWLIRKPHIAFDDTYNMEQIHLYEPFTPVILTGAYEHPHISKKEIRYAGYHELSYLHPNYYKPNKDVLKDLGVEPDEKYVLVRFIALNATHDIGNKGVPPKLKIEAVKTLSKYAKVFISAEGKLPKELEEYRLKTRPEQILDVMAFASLVWGESITIPAEAAVLGVPALNNNNMKSYYLLDEQDNYGLCFCYKSNEEDLKKALQKCIELLKRDKQELSAEWRVKRDKLINNHIDVTAFLVWFVENYPESKSIMEENPNYQYRFK